MTVGLSELDIDDNNQEKCYNNNNIENKNKTQTQTSFSSTIEETFKISANQIPPPPKLQQLKMGRRKQLVPMKTGIGSMDGKS
jgi:hypothetical protein